MGDSRHIGEELVVARAQAGRAKVQFSQARARWTRVRAQHQRERARRERLRAIRLRQTARRRLRDICGPVYAMAAPRGVPDPVAALAEAVGHFAIFKLDRHGHVLTWNPEAQHLLGYTREEVVGRHFSVFADGAVEGPGPAPDILSDTHYEEGWRFRKDGSKFWASVALTPVYADGGRLAGFAMMIRDDSAHVTAVEQQRLTDVLEIRLGRIEALVNDTVERLFRIGLSLNAVASSLPVDPELAARATQVVTEVDEAIRHIRTSMWGLSYDGDGPGTEPSGAEGLRVLVVDDDEDMRVLFSAVLSDLGEVHAAADAYQALAWIEHNEVDVLVLDVLLPGASGIDLLERVHDLGHNVPAVIVSGVDGGSLHQRAVASGATVIMSKPFDKRLLQASVLEAVRDGQQR